MPTTMGRKEFLASLSNDQKGVFQQLEGVLGNKQGDIGWHHRVGCLLRRMLPETDGMHVAHGDKWFETLAAALGWTSAPLYKKLRLAAEFESDQVKELRAWEKQGQMTWTHIVHALTESDRGKRWKLLGKAVNEQWNSDRLKLEVKNRVESRHPKGGRLPRKGDMSATAAVQKFNELSMTWLNFYEHVFVGVIDSQSAKPKAALVELLTKAKGSVRRIEKAARSLEKALA